MSTRRYYVIFQPKLERFRIWHIITGGKFSHVTLMTELHDTSVMVINPHIAGMEVKQIDITMQSALNDVSEDATAILEWDVEYDEFGDKVVYRGIYNCVTIVKSLLGLTTLAFTPKMLYKYMINSKKDSLLWAAQSLVKNRKPIQK